MGNSVARDEPPPPPSPPPLPPGRMTMLTTEEVIEALEAEIRLSKPTPSLRPVRQLPLPGAAALSDDDGKDGLCHNPTEAEVA